jgi:hypothetical protein
MQQGRQENWGFLTKQPGGSLKYDCYHRQVKTCLEVVNIIDQLQNQLVLGR